eukprot:TCONS_00016370-protein
MESTKVKERDNFIKTLDKLKELKLPLAKYLVDLDEKNAILSDVDKNKTFATTAENYCKDLLRHVAENDPRFKNTFLLSGSFYDDCKVGKLDEFDYMVRIDNLSKPGLFEAVPSDYFGFMKLKVLDESICQKWDEFIQEEDWDEEDEEESGDEEDEEHSGDEATKNDDDGNSEAKKIKIFSVEAFKNKFFDLLYKATEAIIMPSNWLRHPFPVSHGPCTMLEFLVNDIEKEPHYVSIDIAPSIAFPNSDSFEFPYEQYINNEDHSVKFLSKFAIGDMAQRELLLVPFYFDEHSKTDYGTWAWHYSDKFRVSFSLVEKHIFSTFSAKSVEKRLYRTLKILKDEYMQDSPGRFPEFLGIDNDKPPSTKLTMPSSLDVRTGQIANANSDGDISDIALPKNTSFHVKPEVSEDINFLSTYVMKSTWLYFMMYQTKDDEEWTEEELGGMVIECLDFLFVIYQEDKNDVNNFFLDDVTKKPPGKLKQQKILLSLTEMVESLYQKVNS